MQIISADKAKADNFLAFAESWEHFLLMGRKMLGFGGARRIAIGIDDLRESVL